MENQEIIKIKEYNNSLSTHENNLIFGDNLLALQALCENEKVKGKVKLVYIDPPFSTNREFRLNENRTSTISYSKSSQIAYEDTLLGEEYLEFLKKRLVLLKEILSDDGSIYLHIDSKMSHYVKIIMDQVFGKKNFINDITRIKSNPKNFSRRAYGNIKDTILFYSKTKNYIWNEPVIAPSNETIDKLFRKVDSKGEKYATTPLHAPGETMNGPTGQIWNGKRPPEGRHWRYAPEKLEELDKSGLIEWSKNGIPRKKIFANEIIKKGIKLQDIWTFKDPQYPKYPTEKNLEMLKLIINASSNKGDLILDAFCGSGSTLLAAQETQRNWIGIDESAFAIKTCIRRMLKADVKVSFTVYGVNRVTVGQEKARLEIFDKLFQK